MALLTGANNGIGHETPGPAAAMERATPEVAWRTMSTRRAVTQDRRRAQRELRAAHAARARRQRVLLAAAVAALCVLVLLIILLLAA